MIRSFVLTALSVLISLGVMGCGTGVAFAQGAAAHYGGAHIVAFGSDHHDHSSMIMPEPDHAPGQGDKPCSACDQAIAVRADLGTTALVPDREPVVYFVPANNDPMVNTPDAGRDRHPYPLRPPGELCSPQWSSLTHQKIRLLI